jgi:uroporphyrinogen-III synthase
MRFLITRPANDTQALCSHLEKHGQDSLLAPMLSIENLADVALPSALPKAIAFTSANGVRALLANMKSIPHAEQAALKTCLVFAVGPATALAAEQAGWQNVFTANGSVASLADILADGLKISTDGQPALARDLSSSAPAVWHIAGRVQAGNLSAELISRGVQAQRVILYDAKPIDALPDSVKHALEQGRVDGVLLYSLRSAEQYLKLTGFLSPAQCNKITAFCLSEKIGQLMRHAHYCVDVCEATHETAMYELIDRHIKRAAQSKS